MPTLTERNILVENSVKVSSKPMYCTVLSDGEFHRFEAAVVNHFVCKTTNKLLMCCLNLNIGHALLLT